MTETADRAEPPTGDTFLLETSDDAPVVVHRFLPEGEVRGVVNLAHGMAEHAARYTRLAAALNAVGLAVYAEDHRGHGRTALTPEDLGYFADQRGWALVLDDLHRVTHHARGAHPGVPVVLLGHSMGSFLAQQYLFTFPGEIDGLVLSGSNGPIGPLGEVAAAAARTARARLGPRGRSEALQSLAFRGYNDAFEPRRTDFDWLSRNESEVDAYLEDPWCGFTATTGFFVDLFAGLRVIGQARRVVEGAPKELPVYLFTGAQDPVGGEAGQGRLQAMYEASGMTDLTARVYPGGRHEMLNELNRDEVVADLIGWLERVLDRGA
ncbi:MAG: lysophospholipase [Nitriliruptoraceae bacterium]|nr:lysophospholipase [Nitriliruptoraceae bacterium]